jgi:hypothetical protein
MIVRFFGGPEHGMAREIADGMAAYRVMVRHTAAGHRSAVAPDYTASLIGDAEIEAAARWLASHATDPAEASHVYHTCRLRMARDRDGKPAHLPPDHVMRLAHATRMTGFPTTFAHVLIRAGFVKGWVEGGPRVHVYPTEADRPGPA